MCVNPSTLPNGITFGCRQCWQCREVRIQDWVGRCIAESKISKGTFSITLTYGGGDHERAAVLTYSDVQKYFKRLRKAGYRFKYLVAGEYGAQKGRAHWHAIMFFEDAIPDHSLNKNFQCKFWDHGHSWWEKPTPKAVRYVCKYIQKDTNDDERQGKFMMSKKPPIGHEYFLRMADKFVEDGITPQSLKYTFKENLDKDGKPVSHLMQGAIAKAFLDRFIATWAKLRGGWWPTSEVVDDYHDSLGIVAPALRLEIKTYGHKPDWLPHEETEMAFVESLNTFKINVGGKPFIWASRDKVTTWRNAAGVPLPKGTTFHIISDEAWLLSEAARRADEAKLRQKTTPQPSGSGVTSQQKPTRYQSTKFVGEPLRPRLR